MKQSSSLAVATFSIAIAMLSQAVFAAETVFEDFSVDTADTSETLSNYSNFQLVGSTPAIVSSGVLEIAPQGIVDPLNGLFFSQSFDSDAEIEVQLGKSNSSPGFNVGLMLGARNIVFHPGLVTPGVRGHFRVDIWDGLVLVGSGGPNLDMGFVPSEGVLHTLRASIDHDTGLVQLQIEDGENPSNVFSFTFSDTSLTQNYRVGLTTYGYLNEGVTFFDNLSVTVPPAEALTTEIIVSPHDQSCQRSNNRPVGLEVAILGTSELDVSTIDFSTIDLDGLALQGSGLDDGTCALVYVNDDSLLDAICMFAVGDIGATLTASTTTGRLVEADGSVCVR